MSKLINLTSLNIDNFVELLKDSELVVYENIQGSKIFFSYNGNEMVVKARSVTNEPINKVDLALQKYYQSAWNYLDGLDERVKKLLPKGFEFQCQYFYDNQPSHIKYDKLPKNNLMLTAIVKNGVFTTNYSELVEYAELLNIECQPVLFKGKLTQKQLELITYFLNTNENDLMHIFGEENFAYFFYKILNPQLHNSFLMNTGAFQDNLEKLIIRVEDEEISFAILNPLYSTNDSEKAEHVDIYTILLIEILEHLQLANLDNIALKGKDSDVLYIELICLIFNEYCKTRSEKIINFNFNIPPFFHEEKFRINIDMVSNSQTKYWIESNNKLQYFFKVILSSFRQRKKKPIGIFNETTLKIFNDAVDKLQSIVDKKLKVIRDSDLAGSNLLNFTDFFKVTYPKDADNQVYPDLYNELEIEDEAISKKKLGMKKKF